MDGTVPQTGFLPGRNRQNAESSFPAGKVHPDWRERSFFRQSACEQGFRPRSPRHGDLRRPLRSTRLGTTLWSIARLFCAKGRLNAKSCVFSTIICKVFSVSPVRVCGRSRNLFCGVRPMACVLLRKAALHCRRQLFLDLYLFFLVRLFYVCGRRTYLASNASSSVPSSSFSIRSGASEKAFGQKVRLCLPVGAFFFDAPFAPKQKFRRSDTPEAAGNGWR